MFRSLDLSTSGLVAQRHRMDTVAGNIANINTTRDESGELSPFKRRLIRFQEAEPAREGGVAGVKFEVQIDEETKPRKVFSPGHPDADADGYVSFPDINLVNEFVNAIEASRAYEANVAAIEVAKTMQSTSLRILQ